VLSSQIIDSDRRCPFDEKLMMLEIGQDDTSGWARQVHLCWHCSYSEIDENWPRPRLVKPGETLAEKLARNRLEGVELRLVYDTSPFPKSEFDEEPSNG
jgi:hypothetical protein